MLSTISPSHNQRLISVLKAVSFILIAIYLVNCITPLRLHVDSIRYYWLKDCMDHHCEPGTPGADDYLPFGYTFLLLALSKLGILKSMTIVLVNCFFLFSSIYFVKKIFKATPSIYIIIPVILLNWSIIKFAIHPLSEMQFMFFSLASLALFQRYQAEKKWWLLGGSLVLCVLAILTRTAGIALFGALIFTLFLGYWKQLKEFFAKHKLLLALGILSFVGIIVFAKQLGLTYYTGFVTRSAGDDPMAFFINNFKHHFEEIAELWINFPANKVYMFLPGNTGPLLFMLLGFLLLALSIYLIYIRKNNTPLSVKVYLAFYTILIFNWPFFDPRFFVPILPLFVAAILQLPTPKKQPVKVLAYLFLAGYIAGGLIAVGYTTYTSLDKKVMARKQANGVYRNEYEQHMFGKPLTDTAKKMDPAILSILDRHD